MLHLVLPIFFLVGRNGKLKTFRTFLLILQSTLRNVINYFSNLLERLQMPKVYGILLELSSVVDIQYYTSFIYNNGNIAKYKKTMHKLVLVTYNRQVKYYHLVLCCLDRVLGVFPRTLIGWGLYSSSSSSVSAFRFFFPFDVSP